MEEFLIYTKRNTTGAGKVKGLCHITLPASPYPLLKEGDMNKPGGLALEFSGKHLR